MNHLQIAEHTASSVDWGSPCRNLGGRERQNVGPTEHFGAVACKEGGTRSPWNQSRTNWQQGRGGVGSGMSHG